MAKKRVWGSFVGIALLVLDRFEGGKLLELIGLASLPDDLSTWRSYLMYGAHHFASWLPVALGVLMIAWANWESVMGKVHSRILRNVLLGGILVLSFFLTPNARSDAAKQTPPESKSSTPMVNGGSFDEHGNHNGPNCTTGANCPTYNMNPPPAPAPKKSHTGAVTDSNEHRLAVLNPIIDAYKASHPQASSENLAFFLDVATPDINAQLQARGEHWTFDSVSRQMLGLPPSSAFNSPTVKNNPALQETLRRREVLEQFKLEYGGQHPDNPSVISRDGVAYLNKRLLEIGAAFQITRENIDDLLGNLMIDSEMSASNGIIISGGGGNRFYGTDIHARELGVGVFDSQNNLFCDTRINSKKEPNQADNASCPTHNPSANASQSPSNH